jgi:Fe-S-cluster containining protein
LSIVSSVCLAFPDGVFDYVCAECNALCCRGHGFAGSIEQEVGQLFTLYPELESTVTERRADIVSFANVDVGCQLLDGDKLCRIEKEHGYDLKPGVCRTFLFN